MSKGLLGPLALRNASGNTSSLMPSMIWGSSHHKEVANPREFVYQALPSGFRGIDAAARLYRYEERQAGDALRFAQQKFGIKREELWIQTKLINNHGQAAPPEPTVEKVRATIFKKLENLGPSQQRSPSEPSPYIDCVLVHTPRQPDRRLLQLWNLLEPYVPLHIRHLGVAHCALHRLKFIHQYARIKPAIVQNVFEEDYAWDDEVRQFCREHGIIYEAIVNEKHSRSIFHSEVVRDLFHAANVSPQAATYALMMELGGLVVMNASTHHMRENLQELEKLRFFATSPRYQQS